MSGTKKYLTTSHDETKNIAKELARELTPHTLICLYGDLGAGKTTFMQGLIEGFGLTRRIVSPTFILMRTYEIEEKNIERLYHADLYRLTSESEVEGTGLFEALEDKQAIVAIEWPDRMGKFIPNKRIDISLVHGEAENEREIEIVYHK